jgi:hypothetical protein
MVTSISLDMPPINLSISSIIDFMVDTYDTECFNKLHFIRLQCDILNYRRQCGGTAAKIDAVHFSLPKSKLWMLQVESQLSFDSRQHSFVWWNGRIDIFVEITVCAFTKSEMDFHNI